jgi:hypothetical protein
LFFAHVPEFEPPFWPSHLQRHCAVVSAIAPSFGVPALHALRVALLHTPLTGVSAQLLLFALHAPLLHRYEQLPLYPPAHEPVELPLAMAPNEQLLIVVELQLALFFAHVPEFEPPYWPSQRQRHCAVVSAIAPSFDVPALHALRVALLHTPFTGLFFWHVPELDPPYWPSQRQRQYTDVSAIAPSFDVPALHALRVALLHTPLTGLFL